MSVITGVPLWRTFKSKLLKLIFYVLLKDGSHKMDSVEHFPREFYGGDVFAKSLSGEDLRDADLRFADFRYVDLHGADLRGADLRWADLTGANLWGADLRRADLRGAFIDRNTMHAILESFREGRASPGIFSDVKILCDSSEFLKDIIDMIGDGLAVL